MQGSDEHSAANRSALTRLGLAIFFTMNVMVFTLVLWTWNVQRFGDEVRIETFREVLRYACLLFSAPVLLLLGGPLLESCIDSLRNRQFTTDVLLLCGVVAAFTYSVISLLLGFPEVYFEVACMILVAVTLGKWLEATAKLKATQSLRSLRHLLPETARRMVDGQESAVPLEEISPGDVLRVLPGERLPVDCKLQTGICMVDEQVVTGESMPRSRNIGETLYGGTLNCSGELTVCATTSADSGTIARMVAAVQEASAAKCRSIRAADRLAAWFVPLITIAAAIAFYLQFANGIQNALMASLSVILIACPCALGLATPLALWVAITTAARNGILFRNGDAVVDLSKLRSIAFDKTGTLTTGSIQFSHYDIPDDRPSESVRPLALRLASASTHPLSNAIAAELASESNMASTFGGAGQVIADIVDHAGKGVTAQLVPHSFGGAAGEVLLGSVRFAKSRGFTVPESMASDIDAHHSGAVVCLAWGKRVRAVFYFEEELRTGALDTLKNLREQNLQLTILTGDRESQARRMEQLTGIRTVGELLPEEKAKSLHQLPRPVGMVGDGINDSIALARADVGIAMDCGADVSRDAADVCLVGNTLDNLSWAIMLARSTRAAIRTNLFWAVAYNVVGIAFAISGHLNPIIAAAAMVASSLFVLANSLRLASMAPSSTVDRRTDSKSELHPEKKMTSATTTLENPVSAELSGAVR